MTTAQRIRSHTSSIVQLAALALAFQVVVATTPHQAEPASPSAPVIEQTA